MTPLLAFPLTRGAIDQLVTGALEEDLGTGDLTTDAVVDPGQRCTAIIKAKAPMMVCGIEVAAAVFRSVDPALEFRVVSADGDSLRNGAVLLEVAGSTRSVLLAERVCLNFLQHLCGIATTTREYVQAVAGTGVRVCETRKTTPYLRALEKYAVRCGGGSNHRASLAASALLKENHIAAAGGVAQAITRARAGAPHTATIEVELATLNQIPEALEADADIIMLDNMSPDTVRQAVATIAGRAIIEVSGNITHDTVADYAATGVDVISIGALVHSRRSADLSLVLTPGAAMSPTPKLDPSPAVQQAKSS